MEEHLPLILGIISIASTVLSVGISVGISQAKQKMFESRLDSNDKITHINEQKIAVRDEEMRVVHKQLEELSDRITSFDKVLIEINIKLTEILTRLNIEKSQK